MEPADVPAVLRLMAETPQAPAWRERDYDSFLRNESPRTLLERRAWVLCSQESTRAADRVVGFAGAALLTPGGPPECELEYIAIAPEHRRQGGGARLMEAVFNWARTAGAPAIRLEVRTSNLAAIRLYRGHGFVAVGSRRGYYPEPPEDALLMEATVDAGRPPVVL